MKWIFTLATLSFAFSAHAQQVHKCVDGRGSVAYQSQPCAAAQTTARTWEAQPDPVSDRPAVPVAEPRRSMQNAYPKTKSRRSKAVGASGASIPVENSGNSRACEAAKATRVRTLERVGLKRTFELLRRLDDAVNRACK